MDDAANGCRVSGAGSVVQGQRCMVSGAGSVVQGQRCMVSGAAAVCSCLQSCSCIATAVMLVMPDFYTIVTMLLDKFEIS